VCLLYYSSHMIRIYGWTCCNGCMKITSQLTSLSSIHVTGKHDHESLISHRILISERFLETWMTRQTGKQRKGKERSVQRERQRSDFTVESYVWDKQVWQDLTDCLLILLFFDSILTVLCLSQTDCIVMVVMLLLNDKSNTEREIPFILWWIFPRVFHHSFHSLHPQDNGTSIF